MASTRPRVLQACASSPRTAETEADDGRGAARAELAYVLRAVPVLGSMSKACLRELRSLPPYQWESTERSVLHPANGALMSMPSEVRCHTQ